MGTEWCIKPGKFVPPSDFIPDISEQDLFLEDIDDDDSIQIWLIQSPASIFTSKLNVQELSLRGTSCFPCEESCQAIRCSAFPYASSNANPCNVLLPNKTDGALHSVKKKFSGQMLMSKNFFPRLCYTRTSSSEVEDKKPIFIGAKECSLMPPVQEESKRPRRTEMQDAPLHYKEPKRELTDSEDYSLPSFSTTVIKSEPVDVTETSRIAQSKYSHENLLAAKSKKIRSFGPLHCKIKQEIVYE